MNINEVSQTVNQAVSGLGIDGLGGDFEFESTNNAGVLQLKSTGRQNVKFYYKEFYNAWATEQKAKEQKAQDDFSPVIPVYDKVLMVEIHTPGEKKPFDGRAEDYHKRTYFQAFQRFMQGKEEDHGTPIENADFLIGPEAMDLRVQGIKSIEKLAVASDYLCETMPRGYQLREHAKMWVTVNHGNEVSGTTKKLSAELSSAQETIEALRKQNESTNAQMSELLQMVKQLQSGYVTPKAAASKPIIEFPEPPMQELILEVPEGAEQFLTEEEKTSIQSIPKKRGRPSKNE